MTESTGQTDPLLVCAPLRFEARAVRRGLRDVKLVISDAHEG